MKSFKSYLKALFVFVLAGILSVSAIGQDTTRTFIISGVPQYIINHGLRLDFEKKLPFHRHWLIISPQYYMGWVDRTSEMLNSQNTSTDEDSLFGYGIDISHKIFLADRGKPTGGYFAYGITFQHFNLGYSEYDWVKFEQNNQTSYEYKLTDFVDHINKYGINAMIGIQGIIVDYIVFDVYVGLGARFSHIKNDMAGARNYNRNYWDYGYSGPLLLVGARLGVLIF